MVPQTRAREARIRGQVVASPQFLTGTDQAGYAERRAYDRIVLGMDPSAAGQGGSPFAGPQIAPRASGLFGVLWC